MPDLGLTAAADAFFHESMERLAGGLGVTFEGVSRDWIAGADPVAGPPAGAQILTASGWTPLTSSGGRYSSARHALAVDLGPPRAQASSRRAASDRAPTDREPPQR